MFKNKLYFGDNLEILRDKISSACIDLIYLDPPFQSGRNYNTIFEPELNKIKGATAQGWAFKDTWEWGDKAQEEYEGLITGTITKEKPNQKLIDLMKSMRSYLEETAIMAYLAMMAPRLLEMRRVLKDTGSIYLHCDPTASHYLKLLMDAIFGVGNFRNEIVWHYRRWTGKANRFQRLHDIVFFYTKSDKYKFNVPYTEYTEKSLYRKQWYHTRIKGDDVYETEIDKRGVRMGDVWDIPVINSQAKERTGYPTQKPETLLEKIIKASANEGDVVCDPFCGCGTAIAVAERLKRNWIGIDITYLAIDVIKKRLEKEKFGREKVGLRREEINFEVDGEPTDVYSAEKLAKDPFQFQLWCVLRLNATPSQMLTGDKGVDGIINFIDPTKKNKAGTGVIQVKGTQSVSPSMVRELKGTIKSQNADFGVLITIKAPTPGMKTEAVKEGYFDYKYREDIVQKKIPKIQLLTVGDLFKDSIPIILPESILPSYKKPDIKKPARTGDLFKFK